MLYGSPPKGKGGAVLLPRLGVRLIAIRRSTLSCTCAVQVEAKNDTRPCRDTLACGEDWDFHRAGKQPRERSSRPLCHEGTGAPL